MTLITSINDPARQRIHEAIQRRKASQIVHPLKKFQGPWDNTLCVVTHGSHLYGMQTEGSDTDLKAIYLPTTTQLLLQQPIKVLRHRFDSKGNRLQAGEVLEAGGYEIEYSSVQKFMNDFLEGQSWATEVAFAVIQGFTEPHKPPEDDEHHHTRWLWRDFRQLCLILVRDFKHKSVKSMADFAVKQTYDYVKRGERYTQVLAVIGSLMRLEDEGEIRRSEHTRLNKVVAMGQTVLDRIHCMTGVRIGSSQMNTGSVRTLDLCGRQYLETSQIYNDFWPAVQKLKDEYGARSIRSAESDVDWKSLSHAVRVYEQLDEYLTNGTMTFPRPNGDELGRIKRGKISLETVKELLTAYDTTISEKIAASTLPVIDDAMRARAAELLYNAMCGWLDIRPTEDPFPSNPVPL